MYRHGQLPCVRKKDAKVYIRLRQEFPLTPAKLYCQNKQPKGL